MAEPAKQEKPQEEAAGGKTLALAPEDKKAPQNKKELWTRIILVLVIVNMVILGGMSYFMTKMSMTIKDLKNRPVVVQEVEPESSVGKELVPKELGTLYALDGFLVNLAAGEGGPKFLQIQMELELSDPTVEVEIKRKIAAVRDAIILLLSSRSYESLKEPNGVKKLRKDLLVTINNLLSKGKVKDIFFTQFHFN